jgi:NADH:ubiquinone oxidoreductase subunit E
MAWNIEEAIQYYKKQGAPGDQTALVSLLTEVQQEHGGAIPAFLLPCLAEGLGIKENYLLALIRRMPRLRLADHHVLELCAGPNCGKHTKLLELAQKIAKDSGGKIEVRTVPCMRMCGKGPNVKWNGALYHGATEQLRRQLADKKR